jgi:Flp pilus assembly protein TadG
MRSLTGQTCRAFRRDARGASAMIFALFVPVLMLLIGGAIDFSRLIQLRSELQDAADAASVGAVGVNSTAFQTAITMSGNGTITAGGTQAKAMFNSDAPTTTDLSGTTVNATVTKTNTTITSVIDVSSTYKSLILGLFAPNLANVPVKVASTSSATMPPYINFYLLLDNTPSMGLGATQADMDKLASNTPASVYGSSEANCAFACHETDKPSSGTGEDYYDLAKKLGVTMRIDVVRQATQNLMTTAASTETLPNQYGMAIYDFGSDATLIDPQNPVAYAVGANPGMTTNLTTASNNAGALDLMIVPKQNYNSDRQTNFTSVLNSMNNIIPTSGSGMTASTPQNVLFMVSDGMQDSYNCSYSGCRQITPIDTTYCAKLRAKGVRIAVLYTTYLLLPQGQDSWFDTNVRPILYPSDTVAPAMQACASPGLYFAVSPSQGISQAMTALFQKVVSVVRINS